MCGIVGIIGLGAADGLAAVRRMSGVIRHRGPDDKGEYAADGFAFGMRRLSIIDLDKGHQPLWTPRGTGIVFNGEIYNYRTLREYLRVRGVEPRTQSDTEVVALLFDLEGLACIDRLEGMFSICLYVPHEHRVYLIRDRLGKKPLYVGRSEEGIYFASETKAIVAGMRRRPEIDRQAIHDYLTLRYVPGPSTMWRPIHSVRPGCHVTVDLHDLEFVERRYWSLSFDSEGADPGRDYLGEFSGKFSAAVEKRLVAADVPVGILLSGGLDSSAVAAEAARLGHRKLHTFSVAFSEGGDSDERGYARLVAESLGMEHAEITLTQDEFLTRMGELVRNADEPLADLAAIPLNAVCRLAGQHVKVVLSGEGADETLAGYDMERLARSVDRLRAIERVPGPVLSVARYALPRAARRKVAALSEGGVSGYFGRTGAHMTRVFSEEEKARLWRDGGVYRSTEDLIRSWYGECRSAEPMDQIQDVYCRSWLVDDLLMKADKMSMAASVELRCPFLDHDLVQWCARLPIEWKVGTRRRGYTTKRILRDYASGLLPEEIIRRPKRGFPVPAYQWLEGKLGGWAEDRLLNGGRLERTLDLRSVTPLLSEARGGSTDAQHKLWSLLILDHWLEGWA